MLLQRKGITETQHRNACKMFHLHHCFTVITVLDFKYIAVGIRELQFGLNWVESSVLNKQ